MKPIKNLAMVANREKPGALELAHELELIASACGTTTRFTAEFPIPEGFLDSVDACCVIGGDGTLLSVVQESARKQVPLIGVNRGSLGFLTTLSAAEARTGFRSILGGAYRVVQRALLEGSTGPDLTAVALNDVLIKDVINSRIVHLEVQADGELVTDYYCDGLIFSTPTGSTAYNLSAGGPLIHPGSSVIAMTPICPHTLSNRTIIFRDNVVLQVTNCLPESELLVALDGQRNLITSRSYPVQIRLSELTVPLALTLDHSYFAVLRSKLKWSGGYMERGRRRS
ncbi:MAG: NAD(+)/NADH kinase [Opitutaceae bacterium]